MWPNNNPSEIWMLEILASLFERYDGIATTVFETLRRFYRGERVAIEPVAKQVSQEMKQYPPDTPEWLMRRALLRMCYKPVSWALLSWTLNDLERAGDTDARERLARHLFHED